MGGSPPQALKSGTGGTVQMSEGSDRPISAEKGEAESLAERFRNGDESAFNRIVLLFQKPVFNMAYRMLNNYEEASDLTQDIFVQAYRSIAGFRGDSKFSTWLYAIAANMSRNRARRLRRLRFWTPFSLDDIRTPDPDAPHPAEAVAGDPLPREQAERSEIQALIEKSIAALPEEYAAAVVMRDAQNLSYEEIASALGCSLGTVKSRIARGRAMIRDRIRRWL